MKGIVNSRYKVDDGLKFGLLISFLLTGLLLRAQQTPLYAHYYLNPYLYNPALVGLGDQSSAYFLYRKQWAGVDGAPETQVFTLDGSLENHPVGLGITFMNDVTNIIGRTGGALTGSYEVKLTPLQKLRFGMSFEALRNSIFFDRVRAEDISDPGILESVDAKTVFEGAAGLSYSVKNLRIGFSGDQLFQNTISHEDQAAFKSLNYTFVRHYYTTAEYLFEVGPNVSITPQLLIRTVQGLKSQFDGYVKLGYKDFVWTNLIYRHHIGAGASIGFKLDSRYVFSYAYEFPTTDLNLVGSSTHEFMLGIKLFKNQSSGGVAEQSKGSREVQNTVYLEQIDALMQQNEQVSNRLKRTERLIDSQNQELVELRKVVESYQEDLTLAMQNLKADESDTTTQEGAFFVVVGALRNFDNAKTFQRILKREVGLDTRIIQNARKSWYLIYTESTDSVKEGLKKAEGIKNSSAMAYVIGLPWVYKKEE